MLEPRLISSSRVRDDRGWFSCIWRESEAPFEVAEENHSHSARAGTIRGLHWQEPQQAKLVRVLKGAILDACVCLTDARVFLFELSAERGEALLVPQGYAHGFCTLTDDVEVSYKVSAPYAPGAQFSVDAFDPSLAIPWPVDRARAHMSAKDAQAPRLYDIRPSARPLRPDPVTLDWVAE